MERNLTSGSVFKNIVYFSLPYLLSYFYRLCMVWQICSLLVSLKVWQALLQYPLEVRVMHMITVMIVGLAMGSTVIIAQAIGGGDKKKGLPRQ